MRKGNSGERRKRRRKKTDGKSGHYGIASSQPPERRPLERCMLVPKTKRRVEDQSSGIFFLVGEGFIMGLGGPYHHDHPNTALYKSYTNFFLACGC